MTLFDQVLAEARPFLANQTERLLQRQCRAHLGISPETLTPGMIPELARWTRIAAGLIIPKEKAESLQERLLTLARSPGRAPGHVP